jgi:hypothetical protein
MDLNKTEIETNTKTRGIKHYFQFGEFFYYFVRVFKKHDPNKPNSLNLRMMHGINRISIVMFLFALLVMILRRIF